MSRRRKAVKREVIPDPRYNSGLVGRFINLIMKSGKKSIAQGIVYDALSGVSEELGKGDVVEILHGALDNARPKLEVKSRRVGGATYQVPVEIPFERQQALAIRWMIGSADKKKGVAMAVALKEEIIDAYKNTGNVVKKKEETHKMAQANRAFAHLRY